MRAQNDQEFAKGKLTYLCDTDEHVEDERFESVGSTSLSITSEPHANTDVVSLLLFIIALNELDFAWEMAEIFCHLTARSFNSHFP